VATLQLAKRGVFARTHERIEQDIARVANRVNEDLGAQIDGPVIVGTPAWEAAQTLVERTSLPDMASVFVIDQSGVVLCHPSLRASPNLSKLDFSEQMVAVQGAEPAQLRGLLPRRSVTGTTDLLSGRATIALVYNPKALATIVVQQPHAGVAAAGNRIAAGMLLWCGVGGLVILGITALGSVVLVRRYDTVLMRANHALEEEVERRTRAGLSIRNGLIFGLAKLADYRDTDTGRHLERICKYSEILARELAPKYPEIDRAWVERLKLASSMHDIGKVGIPDSILLKPGALTAEERSLMETHPLIGADTLVAIRRHVGDDDLLNMGIQVTLSHHERFDGKGYPYRLSEDQIPLAARIVAVADVYDALTSRRVYKPAMSHEQACRIIRESSGKNFDPVLVAAFERVHEEFDQARGDLAPETADDAGTRILKLPEALMRHAMPAAA
jgi:HD-GYP domain-containing protein (c-di-GMP phosphodiesterase class II)